MTSSCVCPSCLLQAPVLSSYVLPRCWSQCRLTFCYEQSLAQLCIVTTRRRDATQPISQTARETELV